MVTKLRSPSLVVVASLVDGALLAEVVELAGFAGSHVSKSFG